MPAKAVPRHRPAQKRSTQRLGRRKRRSLRSQIPWLNIPGQIGGRSAERLLALLLLAALSALSLFFLVSPQFAVGEVAVQGNQGLTVTEIRQAVGQTAQGNVFWINTRRIRQAVSQLPGIKQVRVHCRLPAQVTIEVADQAPQVIWQVDEVRYPVDQDGIIMRPGPTATGGRLVTITDRDRRSVKAGDRLERWIMEAALSLATLLPPELQDFGYAKTEGVSLTSPDGWRAIFGSGEKAHEKVNALGLTLQSLRARKERFSVIDVRDPERVAVR